MGDCHFPCNYIKHRISQNISLNQEECTAFSPGHPSIVYTSECHVCFWLFFVNTKVSQGKRRSHRAVGSLLLQIQMFIRSSKHRYKISWKEGRRVTSGEVNCKVVVVFSKLTLEMDFLKCKRTHEHKTTCTYNDLAVNKEVASALGKCSLHQKWLKILKYIEMSN